MMTAKRINSKKKGKAGELEACAILREHGFRAARSQQYRGSVDSADLDVPRFDRLGLHPEVKRCEQVRMKQWFDQCRTDVEGSSAYPVVIHKRNREPWFATMDFDDFLNLIAYLDSTSRGLRSRVPIVPKYDPDEKFRL
jgi:hypothetical protein